MKRWILAVGGLALALSTGQAEYPTLKVRPKPLQGVPAYPYQPSGTPPRASVTGTGQSRINVGDPGAPPPTVLDSLTGSTTTTKETTICRTVTSHRKTERTLTQERVTTTGPGQQAVAVPGEAATFAMKDQTLRADHCSVSGISVTLYPDGQYAIRFRADQSVATRNDTVQSPNPFRRNLFVLTVRGYAADPLGETRIAATKAAVLQIPVEPFWVNRGEPYQGFVEGSSDAVKRNYKWIDRVDVDFTYR